MPRMSAHPTSADPAPSTGQRVIARRFLAGAVDLVLMIGLFVLVAAAAGTIETDDGVRVNLHDGPALVWLAGVFLYYFLTEALTSRTLGKAMLGLRVVRAEDDGVPSHGAIAARTLLRVVDALPFFYGLGAFVILVNPGRQRIGDLAARTAVVAD
jgi:uncharacterized RDD family membrane protein YckC